jgi:hypothetical protein
MGVILRVRLQPATATLEWPLCATFAADIPQWRFVDGEIPKI